MSDKDHLDPQLEAFFEAARADAPAPSDAFLANILADAAEVGAAYIPAPEPPEPARAQKRGFWAGLQAWGVAGAATACLMLGGAVGYSATTTDAGSETLAYIYGADTDPYSALPNGVFTDLIGEG